MKDYQTIKYTEIDQKIGKIMISRPKALNALNHKLLYELQQIFSELENEKLRALIITGEGKAFIAGADVQEMRGMTPQQARDFALTGQSLFKKIEQFPCPVIAAINGYALGGGMELALSCDIRIADENAKFGQPEVGLGITPGFSGTHRLAKHVGISQAKELIFTAEIINCEKAYEIGLVSRLTSEGMVVEEATKVAKKISNNSKTAVAYSKISIEKSHMQNLDTANLIERDLFGLCFAEEDQKEGMDAFLNKRKPNFK
ncbi:enoyl-CoA hydratase-related protein [Isachenkonia alkalipeptolytica]|nr:enoyl-CoA hydratase-related protein [Isachenkonia alkalipeptolytica]